MKTVSKKIGILTKGFCEIDRVEGSLAVKRSYLKGLGKSDPHKSWTVFGPSNFKCSIYKIERESQDGKTGQRVYIRCTYDYYIFGISIAREKALGNVFIPNKEVFVFIA